MSLSINPNLFPKDGYFFQNQDGVKIFGQTWAGVIARLKFYRKRAGQPEGNPEQEVVDQACKRNPILCAQDDTRHRELVKKASLKSVALNWLNHIRSLQDRVFVTPEEQSRRAQICARCPKQAPIDGQGCGSCRAALQALREAILVRRGIAGNLQGCVVLGEDTAVSSWLEQQTVENGDLPAECWRRRTIG